MNLRKTGILLAWATIIAANGTAQNVQRTSQGIKYAAQGMDVSIEFYSPTIVRVYKTLSETAFFRQGKPRRHQSTGTDLGFFR